MGLPVLRLQGNMKTIWWTIFLLAPLTLCAQPDTSLLLEGYAGFTYKSGFQYHQSGIRLLSHTPIKQSRLEVVTEAFVLDQGFAQILVGTAYQISSSWSFSTLIGLTNTPINPLRLGVSTHLKEKGWEGLGVFQWGPESSYFYVGKWVLNIKKAGLGVRTQRFLNTGLYVDYQIATPLLIWVQPGYDMELKRHLTAFGISAFL